MPFPTIQEIIQQNLQAQQPDNRRMRGKMALQRVDQFNPGSNIKGGGGRVFAKPLPSGGNSTTLGSDMAGLAGLNLPAEDLAKFNQAGATGKMNPWQAAQIMGDIRRGEDLQNARLAGGNQNELSRWGGQPQMQGPSFAAADNPNRWMDTYNDKREELMQRLNYGWDPTSTGLLQNEPMTEQRMDYQLGGNGAGTPSNFLDFKGMWDRPPEPRYQPTAADDRYLDQLRSNVWQNSSWQNPDAYSSGGGYDESTMSGGW